MVSSVLLSRIMQAYSKKKNDWVIYYEELLDFVTGLASGDDSGRYDVFLTNPGDVLTAMLISLSEEGKCSLSYDGSRISHIVNTDYLALAVEQEFTLVESNSEYPFPNESSMNGSLPDSVVRTITVNDGLAYAIQQGEKEPFAIFRLVFPAGIPAVAVTAGIIRDRLLVLAVNKMRNYLSHKNNANYTYQKLYPICKQNTRALGEMIKLVQSNPGRASSGIKKPDDFTFTFWTQLSAFIRKELSDKESKTTHDINNLHSAMLINAYCMYYKGISVRLKQRDDALKSVGERLKKAPFFFQITDIYGFRDNSGPYLEKKYSRDELLDFLKARIKPGKDELLPEIVRLKTGGGKLYYVHKSVLLKLAFSKVQDAHDYYRKFYIDSWTEIIRDVHAKLPRMSDEAFDNDLEKRIKKEDPLLYVLLGYELLYLALQDTKNVKLKAAVGGWMDEKNAAMKSLSFILRLNRRELYSYAATRLPFWYSIVFLRRLKAMFTRKKKDFGSVKKKDSAGSEAPRTTAVKASEAGRRASYKKSVELLKIRYNYSPSGAAERMSALEDEWNPLLDYEARNNLVRDVKSMVRDYMRKLLRETSFAVPDENRIVNIAELLSGNSAFDKIRKKEQFKEYITLYIIKTLSEFRP